MDKLLAYSKYLILVWTIALVLWLPVSPAPIYARNSRPEADGKAEYLEVVDSPTFELVSLSGSPEDKTKQLDEILESVGATNEQIAYLEQLAWHESKYEVNAEPYTRVVHCWTGSGYVAGEIRNGYQYECWMDGYTETGSERSHGLWQILPSTAKGYGCDSDWKLNAQTQAKCALKILNNGGLGQWATSQYL